MFDIHVFAGTAGSNHYPQFAAPIATAQSRVIWHAPYFTYQSRLARARERLLSFCRRGAAIAVGVHFGRRGETVIAWPPYGEDTARAPRALAASRAVSGTLISTTVAGAFVPRRTKVSMTESRLTIGAPGSAYGLLVISTRISARTVSG
jgi:hypothetical protein